MGLFKTKLVSIGLIVGLYALLLGVVNTLHFRFLAVNVVLYDTFLDSVLALIMAIGVYAACLSRRLTLSRAEAGLSFVVALLIGVLYAISIPTIVDRSLSIYILE